MKPSELQIIYIINSSASIYGLLRYMAICAISFLKSSIFQSLCLRLEEGEAQAFAAGLAVELRLPKMQSFVDPLDLIADGMVTPQTFPEHPHRHRQRLINVIIDDHF
jgi:hypothetical protein